MRDARIRLRYLQEVLAMLYPETIAHRPQDADVEEAREVEEAGEPHVETRDASGDGVATSARTVLPHRLVPRLLVPRAPWHSVLGRRVVVADGPDTIETYLSDVLGQRIHVVVHVRPARRANRKPILEAHGPAGLVGYVKVGDSDRARDLVQHEAEVLRMLAARPLKVVVPPTVLHQGVWRGLDVLVVSPLPVTSRRVPMDLLNTAVAEIAALGRGRMITNPVWQGERAWAGTYARSRMTFTQVKAVTAEPVHDHAENAAWGWHGDLAPWNVSASADGRLLVWDWERFGSGVPFGFDALHYFFHRALRRMRPATAAHACLAQSGRVLEPFGLSTAEARRTAAHYLITIADRHHRDGHEPLGPSSRWLNPVVDHLEGLL
ncbi:hypothetical protein [Planotetraspora sp. GP83]|uniref:hypothetical protein n=1 Tax=Planotetraspora sp. GP83 TaxID=3156264 RepID=UPI00351239D7